MGKINDGKAFEQLIASYYSKMGYNVITNEKRPGEENDIIAYKNVDGIKIKILIECKDYQCKLPASKINDFESKARKHLTNNEFTHAVLIAKNGFVDSGKIDENRKTDFIHYYSYKEFISSLINFNFFLSKSIADFENESCFTPIIDNFKRDSNLQQNYIFLEGELLSEDSAKPISSITDELLDSIKSQSSSILLLGEIGSGKTSTLLYLNYCLAKSHLSNYDEPIPIYVPLNKSTDSENIFEFILRLLSSEYGITVKDIQILKEVLSELPIAFLIDGFDEKVEYISEFSYNDAIHFLSPILNFNKPTIITSRSHLFFNHLQASALFSQFIKNQGEILTYKLMPLTEPMVQLELKKRRPSSYESDWNIIKDLFNSTLTD